MNNPVRQDKDVVHQAVLLAFDLNPDITNVNTIHKHTPSDFYMICERKRCENLIGANLNLDTIQFTEYSLYTIYKEYAIFHTLKCKQYQQDSTEDIQQIQELANLILMFCKERMDIGQAFPKRRYIDEYNFTDNLMENKRSKF